MAVDYYLKEIKLPRLTGFGKSMYVSCNRYFRI